MTGASPPAGYAPPAFPSLRLSVRDATPTQAYSLFYLADVWRFTVIWTLILYALFHLGAVAMALLMLGLGRHGAPNHPSPSSRTARTHAFVKAVRPPWPLLWLVPVAYVLVASLEGLMAGSVVGLIIGALYRAAHLSMSTWIPLIWGWINVLVLVVSSFSMQGGL